MVVVVVGGGPAGVMAASVAAGAGHSVILMEKMEKPLRKLRISGKGRCNITNMRSVDDFLVKVNRGAQFVESALRAFDSAAACDFMRQCGVEVIVERGDRVFPASGKAWDVAQAMVRWAASKGVDVRCEAVVESVITHSVAVGVNSGDGMQKRGVSGVRMADGEVVACDAVIVTTGGVSYPATGSTGDGHQMAWDLGHNIVELRPALVPLEVQSVVRETVMLKNVELSVEIDGAVAISRFGDMEFTRVPGVVSGATVLQVSSTVVDAVADGGHDVWLSVDLKPALSVGKLRARIDRAIAELDRATLKVLLGKLTVSALHAQVAAQAGLSTKSLVDSLSAGDFDRLAATLKALRFKVTDYRPFTEAIVTAGGVDIAQVQAETMQSRLVRGLYFAGEVLDVDADTGGFNIQLALSTGCLAGKLL